MENVLMHKITISLPCHLVDFADRQAARLYVSRSHVIAQALSKVKAGEEWLAAEGYRFYAREASEFAAASLGQPFAMDQG